MYLKVAPASIPSKVRASGRGLQPNGIRVNETVDFRVFTEGAGDGDVGVKIIGPGGVDVPMVAKKVDDHISEYTYTPIKEGRHTILITFAGRSDNQTSILAQASNQWTCFWQPNEFAETLFFLLEFFQFFA